MEAEEDRQDHQEDRQGHLEDCRQRDHQNLEYRNHMIGMRESIRSYWKDRWHSQDT